MKKGIKITLIVSLSLVGTLALGLVVDVVAIVIRGRRIGSIELNISNKATEEEVKVGTTYKISTYNVGFGAYSQNYTFFMDDGYDLNGNVTYGYYSTARSKDEVLFNINGAINTIKDLDVDFALFQELDTDSTRSYHVDENKLVCDAFTNFSNIHACNYHSAFLPYPIYDMHGRSTAGITTLSKYKMQEAHRVEFTIASGLKQYTELDRCYSYTTINVSNGKKLYLTNVHMSAYDEGGTIRTKQVEELNTFLEQRKNEGNYVVLGGDFNQDLITYNPKYSYNESTSKPFSNITKAPSWIYNLFDEQGNSPFTSGYSIVSNDNHPSNRNNNVEWGDPTNYVSVIDGFIISDNVELVTSRNITTKNGNKGLEGFAYSDHEPVYMEFKLK